MQSQPFLNLDRMRLNRILTARQHTFRVLRPRWGVVALIAVAVVTTTACARRLETDVSVNLAPLPIGRPMYQMDAQHTGRSTHIGPREVMLLRTFNASRVDVPDPTFGNADIQSSAAIAPDGTAYIGLHSGTVFARSLNANALRIVVMPAWRSIVVRSRPFSTCHL